MLTWYLLLNYSYIKVRKLIVFIHKIFINHYVSIIHAFVEHRFVLHMYVWVKLYHFIEDIIWAVLNIGVIILAPMLHHVYPEWGW